MRILLHLLAAVIVSSQLFSQVHIREKVVVGDKARSVTSLQSAGSCDGVYLRRGGGVVIDPQWFAAHVSRYNWEMWLGTIPVLVGDRDSLPKFIGSYKQWSRLVLTMHYTQPPESAYIPYCLDPLSTLSVGPEYPAFLFYRVLETTPLYRWDIAMKMELTPDSSLEAIPPQQIFDEFLAPWNPYVRDPNALMELPYPGTYRIVIMRSNANGRDDLVLRSPVDTTLLTEAQAHVEDTLVIGPYPAWTQLEMALVSRSSKVLLGHTLYPLVTQMSPSTWELTFEDWTDLDYDDLVVRVELNVGTPQNLALRTATGVIWYGDTVNVALLPVDSLGRLSPLGTDWTYEYSIEMPDSIRRYGTLILDGDPGYEFDHIVPDAGIGRGLQFAANGEEPDSAVALSFHLKATYTGDIIIAKVSPGGGSGPPGPPSVVQKSRERQVVQTARLRPRQALVDDPPEAGDVVLENDTELGLDRDVILLGETKYYAAVKELDPTDPEMKKQVLRLYALRNFDETGKPLFEGQEREVQFATGLTSGAATPTLYYERKWPEWSSNSVKMIDLDQGLLRVVGRYWKEGSEENKVILWAQSTTEPQLLVTRFIEVKKPEKLGDTFNKINDVFGKPIDLDFLLAKFAGENGVPPQILKAQIEKESTFLPSYRWEPFVDADVQGRGSEYLKSNFRYRITVNPNSEGNPGIPSDHSNLHPIAYPHNEYKTTWDRFYEQSAWLNSDASVSRFPGRDEQGNPLWYQKPLEMWEKRFTLTLLTRILSLDPVPLEAAREAANDWLKNKYAAGAFKKVAQTRSAATYGLLQMGYPTAVHKMDYPFDLLDGSTGNLPENLNLTETNLGLAVPYLVKQLQSELEHEGNAADAQGDWTLGYEGLWRIALNMYNGKKDANKEAEYNRYNWYYGGKVLGLVHQYLPKDNK
jgi:hypothetical protein